jgi:hypothetical protein
MGYIFTGLLVKWAELQQLLGSGDEVLRKKLLATVVERSWDDDHKDAVGALIDGKAKALVKAGKLDTSAVWSVVELIAHLKGKFCDNGVDNQDTDLIAAASELCAASTHDGAAAVTLLLSKVMGTTPMPELGTPEDCPILGFFSQETIAALKLVAGKEDAETFLREVLKPLPPKRRRRSRRRRHLTPTFRLTTSSHLR